MTWGYEYHAIKVGLAWATSRDSRKTDKTALIASYCDTLDKRREGDFSSTIGLSLGTKANPRNDNRNGEHDELGKRADE